MLHSIGLTWSTSWRSLRRSEIRSESIWGDVLRLSAASFGVQQMLYGWYAACNSSSFLCLFFLLFASLVIEIYPPSSVHLWKYLSLLGLFFFTFLIIIIILRLSALWLGLCSDYLLSLGFIISIQSTTVYGKKVILKSMKYRFSHLFRRAQFLFGHM